MTKQMGTKFLLASAVIAVAFALSGCPDQGLVCSEGMTPCNNMTCEDLKSDNHNCGACGVACQTGQICSEGACECAPGTDNCNGECVVFGSDPHNCGACGKACGALEVCESGVCQSSCTVNAVQCGQSCVNPSNDENNCGECGHVCEQGKSCHDGVCRFDVVLACFTTGQVVGMQSGTGVTGTLQPLGSAPQALALFGNDTLLSADGTDNALYQANLDSLSQLAGSTQLGQYPNQVLVDGDYVYVTNSGTGSLAVLKAGAVDGDGGVQFEVVKELPFGDNTYPQVMTKVGTSLFVTLYGGFGAETIDAGQKVVEVDVSDPANAKVKDTTDLSTLELATFDADAGTQSIPRPQGITSRNGRLYVALNNLDPNYAVAGPAYVAAFTPGSDAGTTAIELPQDQCLNAAWTQAVGDKVLVSCAGQAEYDSNFQVTAVKGSGLVVIGADDQVASAISVSCPEDAGTGCAPPSLARFNVAGDTVYAGDQSAGRLYVFGLEGNQLVEQQMWGQSEPANICPATETGFSNLSDVLVVP